MNARFLAAAALGALVAGAMPALAGDVSLTVSDGRVTIVARNATPRQILEAWSRQGHTRIVNVERVSGGPTTLIITNEPESKALATVLRSVAGYIAAPRSVAVANTSQYDRILIMPTSYAAPAPAYRASAPAPPMMPQPGIVEVPPDPTSLANDDAATPPPAPVFLGDPNGMQGPPPPVNAPTQGVLLPYSPPPDQNGGSPPVLPSSGQQTAGAPGVLPVPQPAQPQSPQQPR